MNQEQKNASADATANNQQSAKQVPSSEKQELREYYLRQLRLMCPTMSRDLSDNVRLGVLKQRTARLIEMLTLFQHPWTEEVPVLQKACLSYLTMDNVSRKERQQVIKAWAEWSDFQFQVVRYRGLLTQFLQYHHRIGHELENLFSLADTEASPEPQATIEKGGE